MRITILLNSIFIRPIDLLPIISYPMLMFYSPPETGFSMLFGQIRINSSWRRRWIVVMEMGILIMFCNSANGTCVLDSAVAMMCSSWLVEVIRGRPVCGRLFGVWRFLRRARKLGTVRRGKCNSRAIVPSDIDLLRPSILPLSQRDNSFRGADAMALTTRCVVDDFNVGQELW